MSRALPAEGKLILVGLMEWDGEKGIFQIAGCIPGTEGCVNLLNQWNRSCNSSCNCSHHLVKFTTLHCHFPRPTVFRQIVVQSLSHV